MCTASEGVGAADSSVLGQADELTVLLENVNISAASGITSKTVTNRPALGRLRELEMSTPIEDRGPDPLHSRLRC